MTIKLPKRLIPLRDESVEFAHGRLKKCPDLKPLEDWFEHDEGWDEVVMSPVGMSIHLDGVADRYFSNSELRGYVDVPPKARITKAMKIAYARERLDFELRESPDSLHAVKISDDPDVFLACQIISQGQGGFEVDWLGVFRSEQELTKSDEGVFGIFVDQDHISDEKILSLWWK